MGWTPPTADEFERDWLTPGAASQRTPAGKGSHTRKRWIAERLASGAIEAVARQASTSSRDLKPFVPVPAALWDGWEFDNDALFWKTGDLVRTVYAGAGGYGGGETKYRFHDVRFKPDGFPDADSKKPDEQGDLRPRESDDVKSGPDWPRFEEWIRPPDALTLAPWDYATTAKWVHVRLKNGAIVAGVLSEGSIRSIVPAIWNGWACLGDSHFWKTGDVTFYPEDVPVRYRELLEDGGRELTDVRFEPAGFRGQLPNSERKNPPSLAEEPAPPKMTGFVGPRLQDRSGTTPEAAPPAGETLPSAADRRRVGRPSKDYWEEALVEVMRQIWMAELKPRRAADVRHAMAEWIVEQGYEEPKPTQLKERARLVFQVYERSQD